MLGLTLLSVALRPGPATGPTSRVAAVSHHHRCVASPVCVVETEAVGLNALLRPGTAPQRLVFVSGKGGVGKTTTSSSIAVRLADSGLSTLIVSTDPAHSLGDALMQDVSGGKPVAVNGVAGLDAMEVSTDEAVERFRKAVSGFRAADLGLGSAAEEVVAKLGLDDLSDILDSTPPGLDELLALAEVLSLVQPSESAADAAADGAAADGGAAGVAAAGYERIVLDTAPTGHTLRLLAFPAFLDNLLTKLVALKGRLLGAIALLQGLLGSGVDPAAKIEAAVAKLQAWKRRVTNLQALLTDPDVTDFVVVAIPSRLSVAESARLLSSLVAQDVPVSQLVVNQLIAPDATLAYLQKLQQEQRRSLAAIDSGASALSTLALSRVPFFDLEMRGVYPLKFLGGVAFGGEHAAAWDSTLRAPSDRFVLVGGKGGVGKTTTSAALAVACAEEGHNTLVISTDPAHSLGDALCVELGDGKVARVEGVAGASLYEAEIQVDEAVAEFRKLVGGVAEGVGGGGGALDGGVGLADFADLFDAVPPGVDELVALAKIVGLARRDELGLHFDRVIVDTAPTGHTLRLLTYPDFLDRFIDRLLTIRERFDGAASLVGGATSMLNNIGSVINRAAGAPSPPPWGAQASAASAGGAAEERGGVAALRDFQQQMRELQTLLHDQATTEFCIVSIPTGLAIAESERLLLALRDEGIAVNNCVLNRLVTDDAADGYLGRLAKGQQGCVAELEELAQRCDVAVTPVPYFDVEVRSAYGLRAMGSSLFDGGAAGQTQS